MSAYELPHRAGTWVQTTLGALVNNRIRHGIYIPSTQFGSGTKVLKMGLQFSRDRLGNEDMERAPLDNEQINRFRANPGDLLFSRTSMMPNGAGRCTMVTDHAEPFVFDSNILAATPDKSKVDSRFLFYLLTSPSAREQILLNIGGTQARSLTGQSLLSLTVVIPPLASQHRIAGILGGLDDKIELNRQMCATLEEIARAIFRSWFVDFDPVRAKVAAIAEGRDPERAAMAAISGKKEEDLDALPSETLASLRATAALFPCSITDGESGEVLVDWQQGRLGDLVRITIGRTPPRKEQHWFSTSPDDVPWLSIRDMGSSGVFAQSTSECLTSEAVRQFRMELVPAGTVMVSFKLTVGRVAIAGVDMVTNEAIAHLRCGPESPFSAEYLYLWLREFDYTSLSSTSSIATAVNSQSIKSIPVLCPPYEVLGRFASIVRPLLDRIRLAQSESRTLAALRDTLLPKLLSGEIDVSAPVPASEQVLHG